MRYSGTLRSGSATRISRRRFIQAAGAGVLSAVGTASATAQSTVIETWHDLDAVRGSLDGHFRLGTDLDRETPGYDEHVRKPEGGWNPIGEFDPSNDQETPFTGVFDGRGHEIRGLYIERFNEGDGLFAINSGTISSLNFSDCHLLGSSDAGLLAGRNDGDIRDVDAAGTVTECHDSVGGLVGVNQPRGTITDSSANMSVTGHNKIGGFVGTNYGHLVNVSASGDVSGEADFEDEFGESMGGLIGSQIGGYVSRSSASSDVSGESVLGGLVGRSQKASVIDNCTARGVVEARASYAGGLVAVNQESTVRNAAASGSVTGTGWIGGLVGKNAEGFIWDASARGDVEGERNIGGFAGSHLTGMIRGSVADGAVDGQENVGGFVGRNSGTVQDSYASGRVKGTERVGGLVGVNVSNGDSSGTLVDSTSNANVTGESNVGDRIGDDRTQTDSDFDLATPAVLAASVAVAGGSWYIYRRQPSSSDSG